MKELNTTNLVIVGEYYDEIRAQIARGVLKAHDIENELDGELSNSLIRHYRAGGASTAIIPIRLWVREEDAASAIEILGQPVSDPQIPVYEEPPLTFWGKTKRIFADVWRILTLS